MGREGRVFVVLELPAFDTASRETANGQLKKASRRTHTCFLRPPPVVFHLCWTL